MPTFNWNLFRGRWGEKEEKTVASGCLLAKAGVLLGFCRSRAEGRDSWAYELVRE